MRLRTGQLYCYRLENSLRYSELAPESRNCRRHLGANTSAIKAPSPTAMKNNTSNLDTTIYT